MEFILGDAVSLRCKISPRILSGYDELKVIVNLRSRLFSSEGKETRISRERAHLKDIQFAFSPRVVLFKK